MPSLHRADRARVLSPGQEAILIHVQLPETSDEEASRSIDELAHLVGGLGVHVTERFVQKRDTRDAPAYLGDGKLHEVAERTGGPGVVARGPDAPREVPEGSRFVIIVDDDLTPGQTRNLESALAAHVVDRTSVILRVFETRARTPEARLEIELAKLEHELPRIRDDRSVGDREGGGGRAARGHTNVELAKRRARERVASLRRELERRQANADARRRSHDDAPRVALVGYTNAGKSSLMRALTGSDVVAADRLFATLGTTARPLAPPVTPPIHVVDTIGFLQRLPHALLASFRATLAETVDASLRLVVVDASDPAFRAQLDVTRGVLRDVGAASTPTWIILNKVDRLDAETRAALTEEMPGALPISALVPDDVASLRARVVDFFDRRLVEARLAIPYAQQGAFAALRDRLKVVDEEYGETIAITVRASPDVLAQLRAHLGDGRRRATPRGSRT